MGKKHGYGVILDAGSSGTRVYVYEYKKASYVKDHHDEEELEQLPHVKTKKDWVYKVHPGISTFGETPERVGEDHLKDLVQFALDTVPSSEIENTPIFLLATAGMRLLPKHQREALLEHTCSYFRQKTRFSLPDCDVHIQVIPGESEGLYGWIAANYLLGGFNAPQKLDGGKGHHTYGFLDMGGASAQIAFAPNTTEAGKHADDLQLLRLRKVNGQPVEYGVFVTTWLGFGVNEARRRYVEHLLQAYPGQRELPDPCLPTGILVDQLGEEIQAGSPELASFRPHLVGTGKFAECLQTTYPLLEKDKACDDPPCLLNGIHTPAIDFRVNHFVGVSEYWHTTHEIFAMAHKDRAYDFLTYQKQVTDFCSRDWDDIQDDVDKEIWGDKVDEKTVEEVCFKASWLINMLHNGIGVPRVGLETSKSPYTGVYANKTEEMLANAKDRGFLDPFQAVNKIDGTEVSWTLGKMLLYASSQMPPAPGTLAVGFGSNAPGASDFQTPSVDYSAHPSDPTGTNVTTPASDKAWSSTLLSSNYSRRIPGILIFLLILGLAVFLLCGRERRQTWSSKLLSLIPGVRRSRPGSPRWKGPSNSRRQKPDLLSRLSSKFLSNSNNTPRYDRLVEEGSYNADSLVDPHDLELGDLVEGHFSDSSSSSTSSHASAGLVASANDRPPMRIGRSSGVATPAAPAARAISPDISRSSPAGGVGLKAKSYFDSASATSSSGLDLASAGASGAALVVRAESREHLMLPPSSSGAGGAPGAGGVGVGFGPAGAGGGGGGGGVAALTPLSMLRRQQSSRPGSPMRRQSSRAGSPIRRNPSFLAGAGGIWKESMD